MPARPRVGFGCLISPTMAGQPRSVGGVTIHEAWGGDVREDEELKQLYLDVTNENSKDAERRYRSNDPGTIGIGTDPDEWTEGPEQAARLDDVLAQEGADTIVARPGANPRAFSEGSVGWVVDRGAFVLPNGEERPFRLTLVVHREDDTWKVVHSHTSFGVPNDETPSMEARGPRH
jgi:hypothetical protein